MPCLKPPLTPADVEPPRAFQDIKAVVFDLDDTLVNWRQAERLAIHDLAETTLSRHGLGVERVIEAYSGIMAENFISFRTTRKWMYIRDRIALLLERLGVADAAGQADEVTQAFTAKARSNLRFLDGAPELLDHVRSAGLRTALLTNGPPSVQRPKVVAFRLEDRLDAIAISGETGHWKPDAEAFRNVLRLVGAQAEETLMVGDSVEFDIEPARGLGMATCLVDPTGMQPGVADAMVASPRGLLEHLAAARPNA